LSVFLYPEFELAYYGDVRPFRTLFREKYDPVKQMNKPVMIAEMGITGDEEMKAIWWYNALNNLGRFKQLRTIVYFNAKDTPGVWKGYETPDWSMDSNLFPIAHTDDH
jgi:beta-mannanase